MYAAPVPQVGRQAAPQRTRAHDPENSITEYLKAKVNILPVGNKRAVRTGAGDEMGLLGLADGSPFITVMATPRTA
jgi:hypothetical protein